MTTFPRLVSPLTQRRKGVPGFFQRIFSLIVSHEGIHDVQQIGLNKYAYADHILRGLGIDFLKDAARRQRRDRAHA
jgi:hypothetical protein